MKYLDSITKDQSKLGIFDINKNFNFDIANAEYNTGVYLASLRV
ncbi:hypothetical protein [Leuconostoc mesenteroides]|jgi:hypothetical protein|nr:hypothetical protein [Leuconostoc mesenteroides]